MQELSAYLLESKGHTQEEFSRRFRLAIEKIASWLREKGVDDITDTKGEFHSLTKGCDGKYRHSIISMDSSELYELRLEEPTGKGQLFHTFIVMVKTPSVLKFYTTLYVVNTESIVSPIYVNPKCPKIVRIILSLFDDWSIAETAVPPPTSRLIGTDEEAEALAAEISSTSRVLPIVAVSHYDGETIWQNLSKELAFDLTGLTYVVEITDNASWKLTEILGKQRSVYNGAIRLYWPPRKVDQDSIQIQGKVWTATKLLATDTDGNGFKRFRSQLRQKIMQVAALTIVQPEEISEIRQKYALSKLKKLEEKASDNGEILELAKLYLQDNETLKQRIEDYRQTISQLQSKCDALEFALEQQSETGDLESELGDPKQAITDGETRFYKKTHSKPNYDILVRVQDCGHSTWQSAAKAEKAKKGVEKLEGRNNWTSMQHCGTCTGGGMWKVRW